MPSPMTPVQLAKILHRHRSWLAHRNGARANLAMQNISGHRIPGVKLRKAVMTGTDLSNCILAGADPRETDLFGANLRDTDSRNADFSDADMRGATLRGGKETQWYF